MDLTETDTVRPEDERPARRDGTCFYCSQPIGGRHNPDCVIVSKTIVVKATIDLVVSVPRNWTPEHIDFHYNESSWCADNLFVAIGKWASERDEDDEVTLVGEMPGCACGCHATDVAFVREATDEDHDTLPVIE